MNATLVVCLLLLPSPRSIRSLSARESRNRVPLLAAPAGQDTATHPRTFTRPPQSSYLQLENNQRVGGAFLLQPPFPAAQPAAGMFFTQNPLSPPFLWPDLTNRLTKGSLGVKTEKKAKLSATGSLTNGILTADTSCHSKMASASRSFGLEKQQQRCARGSLRRARAWRESAPHWFTCGRLLAAHHPGTNTVTSIAAHTAVPMPGRAPTTC